MRGLSKEIKRNLDFESLSIRRLALASAFVSAVACGVFSAWMGSLLGSSDA
jgi:hypothetical protein